MWEKFESNVPVCHSTDDSLISTMVNGTLLNFGKRYEDDFSVIFDHWPKLHLDLEAVSNQKILKGVYYLLQVV